MTSYLNDHDITDSSLPSINGNTRSSRCDLRSSRIVEFGDHHHHGHGHVHNHHHTHHQQIHSDGEGARHVRFGPSHQLSGSTSSLNREYTLSSSKEYAPRPQSPTCKSRKHILELQDQLRLYKDELSKKDVLITKLTEAGDTSLGRHIDINMSKIEETFSNDRTQALAVARSEAAALLVKVDGLTAQLREVKSQLETREDAIRELKKEVEIVRENEAKHVAIAQSLRERLMEYESQQGSFEGVAERSEIVISSLKREKEECNSKILELESRLRKSLNDKEEAVQSMVCFESKYREVVRHFSSVFEVSDISFGNSVTDLVSRLTGIAQENALLKDKVTSMNEYIRAAELETKASRETILRLASETEEKQSTASRYNLEMERLRQDLEVAASRRSQVEQEMGLMKERLEASQNAWASTRKELDERESKYSHYARTAQESELLVRSAETTFRAFKESLVDLLSDGCCRIEPSESHIKERVQSLVYSLRDKSSHVDLLDSKIRSLNEQLEKHLELQKSADRRTKRVESDYFEIENKLRHMEAELASEGILRDSLRSDKEKYMKFLEACSSLLKLDIMVSDVGIDMVTDAIYGRCEKIARMEVDAINDKQTLIYNLNRKLKSLKEQLESRDLHIDLLRKKVAALEERLAGKTELEREKDTETVKSKKLLKLVEKYKRELQEAHFEIREMKGQLLEGSQFRNRTLEAEGHIECLESKVGQLEEVRIKQAEKISKLRTDVVSKSEDLSCNLQSANQTVQALTRELQTTKASLDESTKREKQLLDLRQVFARMLGLDVNILAVPDYEIIARLEKLILAHQSSAATAVAIDNAIVDMEDGFRQGYKQAAGRVFVRARSPTRKSTTRVRTRTRSLSPQRRKDNRAY